MSQNLECKIDTPDYKAEVWFLVDDFLKTQEIQDANNIKEIIKSKITETCSIQEIQELRDDFSQKWQTLSMKEKMKMYELSAMLSNYIKELRNNPPQNNAQNPNIWYDIYGEFENPTQNFERNETQYFPIEVLWGRIIQEELRFTGKWLKTNNEEKTYQIVAGDIIPLWGNMYEIQLLGRRKSGIGTKNSSESIILAYNWGRTFTLFDETKRPIGTVLIKENYYQRNTPQTLIIQQENRTIELRFISNR